MRACRALAWLIVGACASGDDGPTPDTDTLGDSAALDPTAFACPDELAHADVATVADERVREASGLAPMPTGDLWAHNDSGDGPRLLRIAPDGRVVQELVLSDTVAVDWEDAAARTLVHDTRLYVGSIGDNARARPSVEIHEVVAPALGEAEVRTAPVRSRRLTYGDEASRDAETLLVDPWDGSLVIVSKELSSTVAVLYEAPAEPSGEDVETMTVGGTLDVSLDSREAAALFTGGDVSPDGRWIAVRTYGAVRIWRRGPGESLVQAMERPACVLPLAFEPQGETLAWVDDGAAFVTLSEGLSQPLRRYPWPPGQP